MILTLGKNDPKVIEFRKKVYKEDLDLPTQYPVAGLPTWPIGQAVIKK